MSSAIKWPYRPQYGPGHRSPVPKIKSILRRSWNTSVTWYSEPLTRDLYGHITLQRIPLDVHNVTGLSIRLQYYPRNPIAFELLLCAEYRSAHVVATLIRARCENQSIMRRTQCKMYQDVALSGGRRHGRNIAPTLIMNTASLSKRRERGALARGCRLVER